MKCRAEYAHVIKSNAQTNTFVTIHLVCAFNIEVINFKVNIGVDPH